MSIVRLARENPWNQHRIYMIYTTGVPCVQVHGKNGPKDVEVLYTYLTFIILRAYSTYLSHQHARFRNVFQEGRGISIFLQGGGGLRCIFNNFAV